MDTPKREVVRKHLIMLLLVSAAWLGIWLPILWTRP